MSTTKNEDLPAMPVHKVWQDCGIDGNSGPHYIESVHPGLTKREYFAGLAIQGLASESGRYHSASDMAYDAVKIADALLAELESQKRQGGAA